MLKYNYEIKLISECEAGSGFGSQLINSLLPRNSEGYIIIPASHIKGLMRDFFEDMGSCLFPNLAQAATNLVFGGGANDGCDGAEAGFRITDALLTKDKFSKNDTFLITRTALDEYGIAQDHSLRTTEALGSGAILKGEITINACKDSIIDLAVRFSLLSIMTIGGNRNRGSGACIIKIQGYESKPGELLKICLSKLNSEGLNSKNIKQSKAIPIKNNDKVVFIKLDFESEGKICCPEIPLVGTNVMKSGFTIPASAVQGVLLYSLNNRSEDLASACFNNKDFRTWPLLPITESRYVPCRLSSTHKISKLPLTELDGKHKLIDIFISDYDWRIVSKGSPLKGCDGVLFKAKSGDKIELWRSSDMPRIITAHGVHESKDRGRNFYTAESMAVKKFSGLCAMPEFAAEVLIETLKENPSVVFGKNRSVRGGGKITAEIVKLENIIMPQKHKYKNRLFILQSPVSASGRDLKNKSAEEILSQIVSESGWGEVEKSSASISVLFGWNRHKHGDRINETSRLQSLPVVVPGSVFLLKKAITDDDLEKLLIKGLADGKEQGLGAVLPHPGEAENRYQAENEIIELRSEKDYAERAFKISKKSEKLLSSSQIASLLTQRMIGEKEALDYLDKQKFERPKKIWDRWNPIYEDLRIELLKEDAVEMLQVWHDLSAERGNCKSFMKK